MVGIREAQAGRQAQNGSGGTEDLEQPVGSRVGGLIDGYIHQAPLPRSHLSAFLTAASLIASCSSLSPSSLPRAFAHITPLA